MEHQNIDRTSVYLIIWSQQKIEKATQFWSKVKICPHFPSKYGTKFNLKIKTNANYFEIQSWFAI